MQLNIKNREAYRLATELANLTGETLTQAVTRALAERVERERSARIRQPESAREEHERLIRSLSDLQDRARALRDPGREFTEEDLYDEHGLPR